MDAEQGYASHVLSRIALNAGGAAKSTLDSPLRRTRARHCRGAPSRHSPWRKPGARRGLGVRVVLVVHVVLHAERHEKHASLRGCGRTGVDVGRWTLGIRIG